MPEDEIIKEKAHNKAILNTIGQIFDGLAYVYLEKNAVDELVNYKDTENLRDRNNAQESFKKMVERFISEEDREKMYRFMDLNTIAERIGDSTYITQKALGLDGKRRLTVFSVAKRNEDGEIIELVSGFLELGNVG